MPYDKLLFHEIFELKIIENGISRLNNTQEQNTSNRLAVKHRLYSSQTELARRPHLSEMYLLRQGRRCSVLVKRM